MTVAVVLGTRPEIIKFAPVLRTLRRRGIPYTLLHTGQHYSAELDAVFFQQLKLPPPDHNMEIGSAEPWTQTARMLDGLGTLLGRYSAKTVLVLGDTNSVLAGALAGVKASVPVVHVEAGLRSGDRTMPEEMNRIVADHVAARLHAPTLVAVANLAAEGIPSERVTQTGNTIVDAVQQHKDLARPPSRGEPYALATVHRAENVDDPRRLRGIVEGLNLVGTQLGRRVILPLHPHTRRSLEAQRVPTGRVEILSPAGYLEFLGLMLGADLVLTDSGGVQEESCILRVPCVTLRDNTERPETLAAGANRLAGATPRAIAAAAQEALAAPRTWPNPFGDGHAAARIVDDLVAQRYAGQAVKAGGMT